MIGFPDNTENVWEDKASGLSVCKVSTSTSAFDAVLAIRNAVSQGRATNTDAHDECADIYLLTSHNKPIATMRVNQAHRSALDCEEFYPQSFIHQYRSIICSASRFARHPSAPADISLMRILIREVRKDQYLSGMRVDLINVHISMIAFYARMGYKLLCNSHFIHPRLGSSSYVMFLISRPGVGALEAVFHPSPDYELLDKITSELPACIQRDCIKQTKDAIIRCCAQSDTQASS